MQKASGGGKKPKLTAELFFSSLFLRAWAEGRTCLKGMRAHYGVEGEY